MEEKFLTYALRENELVNILSVANGKACNCICPKCKLPLIAKNGGLHKAPHFAHDSTKECEGAYETALHLLGKKLLYERRKIKLPNYHHDYIVFNPKSFFKEGEVVAFDEIILEQRVNAGDNVIIPDAIGVWKGRQVYIEFANTHFVDEGKREILENLGVASFEVDLSDTSLDEQSVLKLFDTSSTYKSWLSNPELDKKYQEHLQKLREKEKLEGMKRQERLRLQQEEERNQLEEMHKQLALEEQTAERKFNDYKADGRYRLIRNGFGEDIRCPIKAEQINALKNNRFYSHPILKKIIDGTYWNKNIYGRGSNGKHIYLEGNKVMVFPSDIEAEVLNNTQKKGNKLLYAGLKEIQEINSKYGLGTCQRCSHYIETITHPEIGMYEVCNYPKK